MNASELMIGDWVKYGNEYFQVDGYHRITNTLFLKYNGHTAHYEDGCVVAEDSEPIPITEEILAMNGFENGILHTEHVDKVVNLVNSKIVNEDGICMWHLSIPSWTRLPIRYVHELQRALRCCGLNDLADNFKVTSDGVTTHTSTQKNMKASELMICDWVFDKETKRYVQISLNTFRYCSDWERFEPIPLTEEIFRENCFDIVQSGDSLTIWKQKDDEYGNEIYDITIYGSKGVTRYDTSIRCHGAIRKNICHVHELQHALRLCGLNDLADNFKVTADGVTTNESEQNITD